MYKSKKVPVPEQAVEKFRKEFDIVCDKDSFEQTHAGHNMKKNGSYSWYMRITKAFEGSDIYFRMLGGPEQKEFYLASGLSLAELIKIEHLMIKKVSSEDGTIVIEITGLQPTGNYDPNGPVVVKINKDEYRFIQSGGMHCIIMRNNECFKKGNIIHFIDENGDNLTDWNNRYYISKVMKDVPEKGLENGFCIVSLERAAKWVYGNESRWEDPVWSCSVCHHKNEKIPSMVQNIGKIKNPYAFAGGQYCPYCGCIMMP